MFLQVILKLYIIFQILSYIETGQDEEFFVTEVTLKLSLPHV